MPVISSKKSNVQVYNINDFSQGLVLDKNPEALQNNEFSIIENFEYDYQTSGLKTVDGVELVVDTSASATSIFYDVFSNMILFSYISSSVTYLAKVTPTGTVSQVGALTGGIKPTYTIFDDKILIASGGILQYYVSGTLDKAINLWQGGKAYNADDCVVPLLPSTEGTYPVYICTTSGTTASAEPTWVTTGTVTDGGVTWTKITGSAMPLADFIFVRNSKVVVVNHYDDYLYYSGTGDFENWKYDGNEWNAQMLPVGLKDGTNFVGITTLGQDVIVFKSNNNGSVVFTYRIIGEYSSDVASTWEVLEAGRTARTANHLCVCAIPNTGLYFGPEGLRGVQSTQTRAAVTDVDVGKKINPYLVKNFDRDNARIWFVPMKNQVWIKSQSDEYIYIYSPTNGSFTTRKFQRENVVLDLTSNINVTYLLLGRKICKLNETLDTELGVKIKQILRTGVIVPPNQFLVKRIFINTYNQKEGSGFVNIGTMSFGFTIGSNRVMIFGNKDKIHENNNLIYIDRSMQQDVRSNYVTKFFEVMLIVTSGKIGLRNIQSHLAEV